VSRTVKLLILALCLPLAGCGPILSKHALDEGIEPEPIDERLLGEWPTGSLEGYDVKRGEKPGHYRFIRENQKDEDAADYAKVVFDGVVVRLDGRRYLDLELVSLDTPPKEKWKMDEIDRRQFEQLMTLIKKHHLIYEVRFKDDDPELRYTSLFEGADEGVAKSPPAGSRWEKVTIEENRKGRILILEMKPAKLRRYLADHPDLFLPAGEFTELPFSKIQRNLKTQPAE